MRPIIYEILEDLKSSGSVDDIIDTLNRYEEDLVKWFIKYSFKKNEENNLIAFYKIMTKPKFYKAVKKIVKKDVGFKLSPDFSLIISGFMSRFIKDETMDELRQKYFEVASELLKKRVKKLIKIGIDEKLALELGMTIPSSNIEKTQTMVGHYTRLICQKIYKMSATNVVVTDIKVLTKMFKYLFPEDYISLVAINILLEHKSRINGSSETQIKVWNMLTDVSLFSLEKLDKKELKVALTTYVSTRIRDSKRDNDPARRISLTSISDDQFPLVYKVVNKLAKDDENKKYL